jgi:hypothetical protein
MSLLVRLMPIAGILSAPSGTKSDRNLSGSNNGDETHFSENGHEMSN